MPLDDTTTLAQVKARVAQFVAERDWGHHHQPKNLSMSIAIEAAELMEHFQWGPGQTLESLQADPDRLHAVGEEVADVLAYTLSLANALDLDLAEIFELKMKRNEQKYPIGHPGN